MLLLVTEHIIRLHNLLRCYDFPLGVGQFYLGHHEPLQRRMLLWRSIVNVHALPLAFRYKLPCVCRGAEWILAAPKQRSPPPNNVPRLSITVKLHRQGFVGVHHHLVDAPEKKDLPCFIKRVPYGRLRRVRHSRPRSRSTCTACCSAWAVVVTGIFVPSGTGPSYSTSEYSGMNSHFFRSLIVRDPAVTK